MRLWHYKLLDCLDDFHIVAQYRELLAIKRAIDKNGTPNHRLVNKVLDCSLLDFKIYAMKVEKELKKRNISFNKSKIDEIMTWQTDKFEITSDNKPLYDGWHNDRYLRQCYFNLQEKFDCGIVSEKAWARIDAKYHKEIKDTKNENNKSGN